MREGNWITSLEKEGSAKWHGLDVFTTASGYHHLPFSSASAFHLALLVAQYLLDQSYNFTSCIFIKLPHTMFSFNNVPIMKQQQRTRTGPGHFPYWRGCITYLSVLHTDIAILTFGLLWCLFHGNWNSQKCATTIFKWVGYEQDDMCQTWHDISITWTIPITGQSFIVPYLWTQCPSFLPLNIEIQTKEETSQE